MSSTRAISSNSNTCNINHKPSVLVVGFGDLGERLSKLLLQDDDSDFQLVGLRRDASKVPDGVVGLGGDYADKASLLAALQSYPGSFQYVIVAQTPSGGFTEASYQKHYVEATRYLLEALSLQGKLPRRIIYVSSISVYDLSDKLITESSTTHPPRFNGKALLEAETLIQNSPIPSTVMRLAGLYGGTADGDGPNEDGTPPNPANHALARAAAAALHKPLSSPLFAPNSGPSKLHRDDAAAALAHVLRRCEDGKSTTIQSCYVVADASPASNRDVAQWIARHATLTNVEVPGLRELYLQDSESTTVGPVVGKWCDSSLLRSEGWQLQYPSFREGYEQVYGPSVTKT